MMKRTNAKGVVMTCSTKNLKMSSTIIWNLPAVKTCIGATAHCIAKCYARKAERLYPTVSPCRELNYKASQADDFVRLMSDMIGRSKIEMVRIHESGDFYDQAYLDKWFEICRNNPSKRFLAFTKSYQLDFAECPSNLRLIYSIWDDTKYITEQIPCQASAGECGKSDSIQCAGNCTKCRACWNLKDGQNVHFDIH